MNSYPIITAEFKLCNDKTYRRKTKIIFNNDNEHCSGVVLMLNPGSCSPSDPTKLLENCKNWSPLEADFDPTLRSVSDCVQGAYGDDITGFVYIVNLSNKKEPKKEKLTSNDLEELDTVWKDIFSIIEVDITKRPKWLWIAYGNDNKTLDHGVIDFKTKIKNFIMNDILLREITIGKSVNYIHPFSPWFKKKGQDIVIRGEMRNLFNSNAH